MDDVTSEILPKHPILKIEATTTLREWGIYNGEQLTYICLECKQSDETVTEIIHDEDCRLAGASKPTAYADRIQSFDEAAPCPNCDVATDGGE